MTTQPAVEYNPETDPLRTDEQRVKDFLHLLRPLPGGLTIVAHGRFERGGKGSYAGIHVLCVSPSATYADAPYSTHLAYIRAEANEVPIAYSQTGHYDLTLADAVADLATR